VLVVTVRALKYNGGIPKAELGKENVEALTDGFANVRTHIENLQKYGLPVVVAINRFGTDTDAELAALQALCEAQNAKAALTEVFAKGGEGGETLAKLVLEALEDGKANYAPLYPADLSIQEKIGTIAREIYRADGVIFTAQAQKALKQIEALGFGNLPVCVAKTQYSLSDDPAKTGSPRGFDITVRDLRVSAGAGFVVAYTGDIMTMPGLPKIPAAEKMDIDDAGVITGLF